MATVVGTDSYGIDVFLQCCGCDLPAGHIETHVDDFYG
jgi:hypothetical protein